MNKSVGPFTPHTDELSGHSAARIHKGGMEAKKMHIDRHDVAEAGLEAGQCVLHFCEMFEEGCFILFP